MDDRTFVYTTYIATTPEKLWKALTGGDFTFQYWGGRRIQSDWKPGSRVQLVKEDGVLDWEGEVLRADPPKVLSYTFDVQPDPERRNLKGETVCHDTREAPSRVTYEIEPFLGKVKLTVTHDQFPPDSEILKGVRHGWPAILSSLKSLLECGEALFPDSR